MLTKWGRQGIKVQSRILGLTSEKDAEGFISKYISGPWRTRSYPSRLLMPEDNVTFVEMWEERMSLLKWSIVCSISKWVELFSIGDQSKVTIYAQYLVCADMSSMGSWELLSSLFNNHCWHLSDMTQDTNVHRWGNVWSIPHVRSSVVLCLLIRPF